MIAFFLAICGLGFKVSFTKAFWLLMNFLTSVKKLSSKACPC